MDGMKQWYQSKAVWGGVIAVAASLLQLMGYQVSQDLQGDLVDQAVTLAGVAGGLVAIWGRLSATHGISGK
ncbi:MAG: hypothetical protein PW791_13740 [Neorhizobium sp.]|nr:hypothetical protein [Neorhizobium sp.]